MRHARHLLLAHFVGRNVKPGVELRRSLESYRREYDWIDDFYLLPCDDDDDDDLN